MVDPYNAGGGDDGFQRLLSTQMETGDDEELEPMPMARRRMVFSSNMFFFIIVKINKVSVKLSTELLQLTRPGCLYAADDLDDEDQLPIDDEDEPMPLDLVVRRCKLDPSLKAPSFKV